VPGRIRIGCSGWVYRDWRGVLYPPRLPQARWLERYAEVFDTVEVNSTFYRLARPEVVERWIAATPPGFLFTVKASQYLTHFSRLRDLDRGVDRFYAGIAPLVGSPKLGPVLWQLPGRQERDDGMLKGALAALPSGRHVFEFRHPSWFVPEVLDLLRAQGVGLVVGDHPERPWQPLTVTGPVSFVRLHFGARGRRGNYSDAELGEWAGRIARLAEEADVLVYLNNDWEGFAVRNARCLQRLLGVRVGGGPAPPAGLTASAAADPARGPAPASAPATATPPAAVPH